ncbi:MAG TPA: galactonate dehydratase [Gaiellaceae bacterium]|nr:galactonate dehydratase [Gaiellaceae bacterium]
MKISSLEPLIVDVGSRNWLFVLVETDEGLSGVGEGSLPGHPRAVAAAVEEFREYVVGEDPARIQHLWQLMYRQPFFRSGAVAFSAMSAIEQALWDIKGKVAGLPVYELLGGRCHDRVKLYANGPAGATLDELADDARALVERGFTAMKTSIAAPVLPVQGDGVFSREAAHVEALREAVGEDVEIAWDAHGRLTPAMSIKLARALEPYDIWFLEEPALPENAKGLAQVARATSIPVATGERLLTKWGFREVLELGAAALLQPDLAHCGGVLEARAIAAMAEVYYCGFAPHNPLGPVNTIVSAHVGMASPNFVALELCLYPEEWTRELLTEPLELSDGYLELSDKPGWGIELDVELCRGHPYKPHKLPALHHPSGAIADW